MRRLPAIASLVLAACVPEPLDEAGKRCGPTFGECTPSAFVCVASVCQPLGFDAGPTDAGSTLRNLLSNPSFERPMQDGEWSGNGVADFQRVTLPAPDAGRWAGSLVSRATQAYGSSGWVGPLPTPKYCLQVMARARRGEVALAVGVFSARADGGLPSEDLIPTRLLHDDGGYVLIGPLLHTPNADDARVQVRLHLAGDAGQALLVDDARLWGASAEGCGTPPPTE